MSAPSQQPSPVQPSSPSSAVHPRPWPVTVTVVIAWLEAAMVLYAAVLGLADLRHPSPVSMAGRIFLPVLMIAVGLWQVMAGLKHAAGRAWTRSPLVVWQLFQIILSIYYLSNAPRVGDTAGVVLGVSLLVPAAVALVLIFSPATRRFLEPDDVRR